jgi:hypothetical protein
MILSRSAAAHVSGDLDEIWWRGSQWAVTAYGIEALDGRYPIAVDYLLSTAPYWPQHMAEKSWVDTDDFRTAFCVALVLHGLTSFPAKRLATRDERHERMTSAAERDATAGGRR